MRDAAEHLSIAKSAATTLMDSRDYQLLLVEAPDVEPGELRAAVRWRIKDLIDFHIDDAVIDVFEIPGQVRGRSRMMYVVAARTSRVSARIADVESMGFALNSVDIEELALRNLAALSPEDERGTGLLRLAPEDGLIVITSAGELYLSRRIELGARDLFTAAQHGDPDTGDFGPQLAGHLDQITLEIQRSLDYYDSHFGRPPLKSLLVAPSDPETPYLADALAANLSLPVTKLDLAEVFPDARLPAGSTQARCLTAVGAASRIDEVTL